MDRFIFLPFLVVTLMLTISSAQDQIGDVSAFDIGRSSAGFAAKLYQELLKSPDTKNSNILMSPVALQLILGLLQVGAEGPTASELSQVLELPLDKEQLINHLIRLRSSLSRTDKNTTINIANAIYTRPDVQIATEFNNIAVTNLGAAIRSINLFETNQDSTNGGNFINEVNSWVSHETNGQIKEILQQDDVTIDTVMLLINALHFKGKWRDAGFDSRDTLIGNFYKNRNTVNQIPMMRTTGYFNVGRNEHLNVTYLELPYSNEDFVFLIILPDEINGLSELTDKTTYLLTSPPFLHEEQVDVRLPRFKIVANTHLKPTLEQLGLSHIFSNSHLGPLTQDHKPVSVSNVVHNTALDVTEEGTEAAAATVVGVVDRIFSQPIPVYVDRPFMFALKQKSTGVVLFIGQFTGV